MVEVEGKQITGGFRSDPDSLVYAKCSKTHKFVCIGKKSTEQRYSSAGGLTVELLSGRLHHYFGKDRKAILGYKDIIDPEELEAV
jgi:hypothetical protein